MIHSHQRSLGVIALLLLVVAIGTNKAWAESPTGQEASTTGRDPRFGAVEAFVSPQLASAAGVSWERVLFWWYALQPKGPGDWNEAYFPDALLQAEQSAGRTVVGCLMNPPPWANGSSSPTDPPKNLYLPFDDRDNYWGQFVKRIVTRYQGRIEQWIIGNEPDVWDAKNPGFTWNGSVADYYQFVKVAYQAAKAANPKATIILGGLTYWWDAEYGREQYFRRLLDVARRDPSAAANSWYFDAVALQLYNDPRYLLDIPQYFRDMMKERGVPEKPIWVTETNVAPWDDPVDPISRERYRATSDEQASYVIQAFAYALAAGVDRLSFYKMADSPDLPRGVEHYGLTRADGSTRPAYLAYQVAARYLSGARNGQVRRDGSIVRVTLERDGALLNVLWNATAVPVEATVPTDADTALLVDREGSTKQLTAGPGGFSIPLPPATANTDPASPLVYRIGGPPFILVEQWNGVRPLGQVVIGDRGTKAGLGEQTAQHVVSGQWLNAYHALGGLDNLGIPRTDVIQDSISGGRPAQYFQRVVLDYHPENPPAFQIQRRLLGDILYPGAEPPVSRDNPPPGPAQYFPVSPGQPTGLGHFVADYTRSGEPTYFKAYFDSHGASDAFGYPKEEPVLRDGRWTQRFQAAVFEYHAENDRDDFVPGTSVPMRNYRVQLALLGDEFIRRNNLPYR